MQSIVAAEDDWGVMAGHHLELAGSSITDHNNNPDSSGLILLDVDEASGYQESWSCDSSQLAADVGAPSTNLGAKVWPTLNRGLPLTTLFEKDNAIDRSNNTPRIWSFDDTGSLEGCEAIACSRDSDSADALERDDLEESGGAVIRLSASELCQGTGDDCHIFVEHINLTSTRLLIETTDGEARGSDRSLKEEYRAHEVFSVRLL